MTVKIAPVNVKSITDPGGQAPLKVELKRVFALCENSSQAQVLQKALDRFDAELDGDGVFGETEWSYLASGLAHAIEGRTLGAADSLQAHLDAQLIALDTLEGKG